MPAVVPCCAVPAVIELEEEMLRRPGYAIVRSEWQRQHMAALLCAARSVQQGQVLSQALVAARDSISICPTCQLQLHLGAARATHAHDSSCCHLPVVLL